MTPLLPETEITRLCLAIIIAEFMAEQGRVAAGFLWLRRGRQRAATAQAKGAMWGRDLVRRYQEALDAYEQRHPLRP